MLHPHPKIRQGISCTMNSQHNDWWSMIPDSDRDSAIPNFLKVIDLFQIRTKSEGLLQGEDSKLSHRHWIFHRFLSVCNYFRWCSQSARVSASHHLWNWGLTNELLTLGNHQANSSSFQTTIPSVQRFKGVFSLAGQFSNLHQFPKITSRLVHSFNKRLVFKTPY